MAVGNKEEVGGGQWPGDPRAAARGTNGASTAMMTRLLTWTPWAMLPFSRFVGEISLYFTKLKFLLVFFVFLDSLVLLVSLVLFFPP